MASLKLMLELRETGLQRQQARQQAQQASARLAELVHEAFDDGIPKAEIARLAKLSRPALDTMLSKQPEPRS